MSLQNEHQQVVETVEQALSQEVRRLSETESGLTADNLSRRGFLKLSGVAGGGLVLAMALPSTKSMAQEEQDITGSMELNTFIKVTSEGKIQIYAQAPDMGQGVRTALPMIAAEELGVKWEDVEVLQAPVAERFGVQFAGGSLSVPREYQKMREMGASAREMFIGAAAAAMNVPREELKVEDSMVIHTSGQSMSFAELAQPSLANQPVPDPGTLKFKDKSEYKIIGSSQITGIDNTFLVTGNPLFGIDIKIPDMLYASYMKCPSISGKAVSANLEDIKRLPGIKDAFIIEGDGNFQQLLSGVAIVGNSTWAVFNAKQQLKVEWDTSSASKDSWTAMVEFADGNKDNDGSEPIAEVGDVAAAFADPANKVLTSHYEYPFLSHFCLEPINCTADYKKGENGEADTLDLWAPHQFPARMYTAAETVFGLPKEQVMVHPVTRIGGGFGRRFTSEFVCEAIAISKHVGAPVKLTWSREDCVRHDFYRSGGFQTVKAAVDADGKLVAWQNHLFATKLGERYTWEGRLNETEFPMLNVPNVKATKTPYEIGTPCGALRAPGSNVNAFVAESFINELAVAAGRDHLEFLLEIMGEPRWFEEGNPRSLHTGRAAGVIKAAAEKAGWGRQLPAGQGLGLAFHFSHAGYVAQVADVTVSSDKKLIVNKVTVAVDVGPIINMSGARAQVEGSVIDGISAMVGQKITMEDGAIEQSNFHDYPVMRIPATPEIDIHFLETDNPPTGLGEPAYPVVTPAVTNAIFAATGQRIRKLPLREHGYSI